MKLGRPHSKLSLGSLTICTEQSALTMPCLPFGHTSISFAGVTIQCFAGHHPSDQQHCQEPTAGRLWVPGRHFCPLPLHTSAASSVESQFMAPEGIACVLCGFNRGCFRVPVTVPAAPQAFPAIRIGLHAARSKSSLAIYSHQVRQWCSFLIALTQTVPTMCTWYDK